MAARRTVLDVLVTEYGMPEDLAMQLRSARQSALIDDVQAAYFLLMELAMFIVSTPAHPEARRTHARNQWMAMEWSYHASRDPHARKKTAQNWGEDVKTINRARKLNPQISIRTKLPNRSPKLLDIFEHARADLGGPKAKSKYRRK